MIILNVYCKGTGSTTYNYLQSDGPFRLTFSTVLWSTPFSYWFCTMIVFLVIILCVPVQSAVCQSSANHVPRHPLDFCRLYYFLENIAARFIHFYATRNFVDCHKIYSPSSGHIFWILLIFFQDMVLLEMVGRTLKKSRVTNFTLVVPKFNTRAIRKSLKIGNLVPGNSKDKEDKLGSDDAHTFQRLLIIT